MILPYLFVLLGVATLGGEAGVFTNSWAVEVTGGPEAADQLAAKHGFINHGSVSPDLLDNIYHFVMPEHTPDGKRSLSGLPLYHLSSALEREENVGFVQQQETKKMVKKGYTVPTDPGWNNQWQLSNRGQLPEASGGRDLRVERAWLQGLTGCGTVVSIVDDGVEYTHTDLRDNYVSSLGIDVLDNDDDPFPIVVNGFHESHGTSCAGEIGMTKSNAHCGVGVAYNSHITGIRLLGDVENDITDANALGHATDRIQISSNSWGPSDNGRTVEGPGPLLTRVLQIATRTGRQGKGTIFVFASGNGGRIGDNCAADGYSSSIYTIGIGAAVSNGEAADYDEQCAGKLAVTFIDSTQTDEAIARYVTTTSAYDACISNFDGTSAAAPLAAGIIALMLEANSALTWRDVQYLIVYTSNQGILVNGEWFMNGATPPLRVSHKFGFGVLDAEALVTRARNWINVPEQQVAIAVPANSTGLSSGPSDPFVMIHTYSSTRIRFLEHVVVELSLVFSSESRAFRGNIQAELTSPSGTISIILPYRTPDILTEPISSFPFSSVHFWGEDPNGEWNLTVLNQNTGMQDPTVEITIHSISLYGTSETPQAISRIPSQCHESCDPNRGCAAADATQYCDACANLRNAMTLECIDTCPQNHIQRNGYCYDDSVPEPECTIRSTSIINSSLALLITLLAFLTIWL